MMRSVVRIAGLTGLILLLVACGGASSPPPSTDGPGTGSAAPVDSAQPPASSYPAESTAARPSTEGGGGGGTTDVCALVTVDELEQIFAVSAVTTRVLAGPPDTCDVQTDGAPLAAFVLVTSNGAAIFNAWAADPDAVDVPGLGDRAIYSPGSLLLVVLKGDQAMSMAVLDESRSEEERLELMKEAMSIAVDRL
jgi:hypothetical protein